MALKIIAVDDEQSTLDVFKVMAEPMGCQVIAVADSRDAARLIELEKFDGAVIDVQMPHIDGFDLTRIIRKSRLNRHVPIVMLTGHDDVDTMRKGFQAGASFFLGKPFNRERLSALFGATRGIMLQEKRQFARLPLRTTVTCRLSGPRQGQFKAGSVDISEGGMLMGPSGGLDAGQEVDLEFVIPGWAKPLKPRAKVLRREKNDQIAVTFVNLANKDRDAVRGYINARVRG